MGGRVRPLVSFYDAPVMAESPAFAPDGPLRALIARVARLARDQGAAAYVVGGAVRDVLLGRRARDLDIAVAGDAVAFARRIAAVLGGRFVELDGENGVARIVLDESDVRYIDVAQLRGALQEDLRRRDFTIDALAVPLEGGRPVDVCGGLEDLRLRLVRMNSPSVFVDDPLRLLRGARIASELGFEIEPATEAEIMAHAPALAAAGAERRRDELARIFALEAAYQGLRLLDRLRLLDVLLPEVTSGRAVEQPGGWHAYDVFEHNMHAVEAMDLMLASDRPVDDRAWLWDALWSAFGWRRSGLRACIEEEMTETQPRIAAEAGGAPARCREAADARDRRGRSSAFLRPRRSRRRARFEDHAAPPVLHARAGVDVRRMAAARSVYELAARAFLAGGGYSAAAAAPDRT